MATKKTTSVWRQNESAFGTTWLFTLCEFAWYHLNVSLSYYFHEHLYRVSFHWNPRILNLNFKYKTLVAGLSQESLTLLWMLIIKINSASHMNNNTWLWSFTIFGLCLNVYCHWQLCYPYQILNKNKANSSFTCPPDNHSRSWLISVTPCTYRITFLNFAGPEGIGEKYYITWNGRNIYLMYKTNFQYCQRGNLLYFQLKVNASCICL